mmetsp:Transcript_103072/g.330539  ORF Transcript_103072/g.330539 Transcript_103072/m.330539 type:complete len:150 (+) Transcript_103072:87-536(+)
MRSLFLVLIVELSLTPRIQSKSCGEPRQGATGPEVGIVYDCGHPCCCQFACEADERCSTWQFITAAELRDFQLCYLKSSTGLAPNPSSYAGAVTGPRVGRQAADETTCVECYAIIGLVPSLAAALIIAVRRRRKERSDDGLSVRRRVNF